MLYTISVIIVTKLHIAPSKNCYTNRMTILVTGGCGYIGTHTIIELYAAGHSVVVIDNLVNSSKSALTRVEKLVGATIPFYEADLRDDDNLMRVLNHHPIDAVIHFAGLKAVGESTENPARYYHYNVVSTLTLLRAMQEKSIKTLIFSSSATVYGSAPVPYIETSPAGVGITSPYGKTKYMVEEILSDIAASNDSFAFTSLRYFNPIGAHESGQIGEDPTGIPNNLMPFITQVASGKREHLKIWGDDYPTPDGTGVRDYIHVVDLAKGHVAALHHSKPGYAIFNIGSGKGTSVLELIHAFEKATGKTIPYEIAPRRPGDLPKFYADVSKATTELHWRTEKSIENACRDSWNWQSHNPNGYTHL